MGKIARGKPTKDSIKEQIEYVSIYLYKPALKSSPANRQIIGTSYGASAGDIGTRRHITVKGNYNRPCMCIER